MELRHLAYFVAVARAQHFGRAADGLHMAQPPLSRAIRRLEHELGVDLLARTTRQVALTPAGAVFLEDAQRILESVDAASARVRDFADGRHGLLRIAFTGSASFGYLPEIARVLGRELPDIALDISTEMLTPAQEEALADGRLDLGVLRLPVTHPDLAHRTVAREPLVLALPPHHRLAGDPDIALTDLRGESFVMYAASTRSVVSAAAERACRAVGFTPRVSREVTETSTMLALVAAGLGVALVPASARTGGHPGLTFADVPGVGTVDLAFAWRRDDTSAVLDRALEALESVGEDAADPADTAPLLEVLP